MCIVNIHVEVVINSSFFCYKNVRNIVYQVPGTNTYCGSYRCDHRAPVTGAILDPHANFVELTGMGNVNPEDTLWYVWERRQEFACGENPVDLRNNCNIRFYVPWGSVVADDERDGADADCGGGAGQG
jgi:hypothetical protein